MRTRLVNFALAACLLLLFDRPESLLTIQTDWESLAKAAFLRGELETARRQAELALLDSANAPAAHELLGHIAFQERQNQQAISHFQAASDAGLLTLEMTKDWSAALLAMERHEEARDLLERALSQDASQSDLRYRLASSYSAQGKWKESWPHWEEVYRKGLRHTGVVLQLARARFAAGQDLQAVQLLENLASGGAPFDPLWEAGKLLFEKTLYRQALVPLQKVWHQKQGSYDIGMYLALSHYLIEQYAESETVLLQIQSTPDASLEYRILRGSVRARLEKWAEARKDLEDATRRFPQRADGYLNFGLFCLERGENAQAMDLFEKASRLPGKGTKLLYTIRSRKDCEGLQPPSALEHHDSIHGELYSQLAEQLQARQQSGSAIAVFLLALDADHRSERAYAGLGKLCTEQDSVAQARAFLEKGLELHPESVALHFNLGLLLQSLGQPNEAIQRFQRTIELRGLDAAALDWIQLGTAQQAGGNQKDAERSFLKGLSLDPGLAQGHFELGKLYLQRGAYGRAEQSLEKAIQLDSKLLGAYYQYGLACMRSGKTEKGKGLLQAFHQRKELYGPEISAIAPQPSTPQP